MQLKYQFYLLILVVGSVGCSNKYLISVQNNSSVPLNLKVDNLTNPGPEQNILMSSIEPKGGKIPHDVKDQFYKVGSFKDKTIIKTTLTDSKGLEVKSDQITLLSDSQILWTISQNVYDEANKSRESAPTPINELEKQLKSTSGCSEPLYAAPVANINSLMQTSFGALFTRSEDGKGVHFQPFESPKALGVTAKACDIINCDENSSSSKDMSTKVSFSFVIDKSNFAAFNAQYPSIVDLSLNYNGSNQYKYEVQTKNLSCFYHPTTWAEIQRNLKLTSEGLELLREIGNEIKNNDVYYLYGFMYIQDGSSKTYKRDAVNFGGSITPTTASISGASINGKGGWQETNSGSKQIQNLVVGVLYKKLEPIVLPNTLDQTKKTDIQAVTSPEQPDETKVTYGSPVKP